MKNIKELKMFPTIIEKSADLVMYGTILLIHRAPFYPPMPQYFPVHRFIILVSFLKHALAFFVVIFNFPSFIADAF